MNKKAIAILGAIFLLIVGTLGYLIYTRYSTNEGATISDNTPQPDNGGNGNPSGSDGGNGTASTSPVGTSGFYQLTSDQVVTPVLFYDGTGIAYFDRMGQVFLQDFATSSEQISLTRKRMLDYPQKPNIERIAWPLDGYDFIVETVTENKKAWSYFNSETKEYKDFPPQIFSFDWMPDGKQMLYTWRENGKATLNISKPDATDWREISEMYEQDNALFVSPDGLNILYYRTENASLDNAINLTSPDGKVWKGLVKEGYNFGVRWAPDSKQFVFAKKEPTTQKYQLWHYNLLNNEAKNLGLFTTAEKVVWDKDSKFLYAAVPTVGTAGSGMLTQDTFYKVSVETPSDVKEFNPGSLTLDGRDLMLDKESANLFFRNAQDGGLYYLDLTK